MLTVGSLFAGIGGIDIAFQQAGFKIVWQVEIDDYCRHVLSNHFPTTQRYGDVYTAHNLPHVDVITAGFPCQPFSVAGKRLGADDERFLVPEMLRVIQEVQPSVVFLENVPHFATLNDGSEFRQLLQWFAENGYDAQWQHIRAEDAGAPHRRERWFCVAYIPDSIGKRRDARSVYKSKFVWRDMLRDVVPTINKRRSLWDESGSVCGLRIKKKLPNSDSKRFKKYGSSWKQIPRARLQKISSSSSSEKRECSSSSSEPRMGGNVDGLPYRVDRHKFPAGRGQQQHDGEPSRVTDITTNRRQRIRALGNAVVPQVIYPTAVEIWEYLENQKHPL
jgi:DNA (cytosine-5)-methyltransferase 1